MPNINCQFSEPVNLKPTSDLKDQDFEFSKINCQYEENPTSLLQQEPEIYELIEHPELPREFYVEKTMSYGDILVLVFLSIFLIFGIVKFISDFLIPKLVNFMRK